MRDDTEGPAVSQAPRPAFLKPRDIQQELQLGERLVYKLLGSGAIPSVKINGRYRVRAEDFEKALESGAVLEVRP